MDATYLRQTTPSWIPFRGVAFFVTLILMGLMGLLFFGVQTISAAEEETAGCWVYNSGRLQTAGSAEFPNCARVVIGQGDMIAERYQVGRWGDYTVVADGERIYVRRGRNRFRYWGALADQSASPDTDSIEKDQDGDRIVGAADQCPNEAETSNGIFDSDGCPDSIDDLLNFAANDLNRYWSDVTGELGFTYRPPRAVESYRNPSNRSLAYNAFYAPRGHFIAYDMNLMTQSLNRFGDFAPVVILAHEFAHLTQNNLGLEHEYTIASELQADCLAGAYTRYLAERGNLEEGDLEEGLYQMYAIGDSNNVPWFHPRAHGTGEQRYNAFLTGYEDGVVRCLEAFENAT